MRGRSKAYHHTHGTAERINKHVAKYRATGGKAAHEDSDKGYPHESADEGDDDAKKDLEETPPDRTAKNKVASEAEEMHAKRGGKVKKHVGKPEGGKAMHHAGRKARKSGGAAENTPFTTANAGTPARGRKLMSESMGRDS